MVLRPAQWGAPASQHGSWTFRSSPVCVCPWRLDPKPPPHNKDAFRSSGCCGHPHPGLRRVFVCPLGLRWPLVVSGHTVRTRAVRQGRAWCHCRQAAGWASLCPGQAWLDSDHRAAFLSHPPLRPASEPCAARSPSRLGAEATVPPQAGRCGRRGHGRPAQGLTFRSRALSCAAARWNTSG